MQTTCVGVDTVTQVESTTAICSIVFTYISEIARARGLFPDDCFTKKKTLDFERHVLKPTRPESNLLNNWLMHGVNDAIAKQYVSELILSFHSPNLNREWNLLESYVIKFRYFNDNFRITLGNDSFLITKDQMREATCNMIRQIASFGETIPRLPPDTYFTIQLQYNNNTPDDYEPLFFQSKPDDLEYIFEFEPTFLQPLHQKILGAYHCVGFAGATRLVDRDGQARVPPQQAPTAGKQDRRMREDDPVDESTDRKTQGDDQTVGHTDDEITTESEEAIGRHNTRRIEDESHTIVQASDEMNNDGDSDCITNNDEFMAHVYDILSWITHNVEGNRVVLRHLRLHFRHKIPSNRIDKIIKFLSSPHSKPYYILTKQGRCYYLQREYLEKIIVDIHHSSTVEEQDADESFTSHDAMKSEVHDVSKYKPKVIVDIISSADSSTNYNNTEEASPVEDDMLSDEEQSQQLISKELSQNDEILAEEVMGLTIHEHTKHKQMEESYYTEQHPGFFSPRYRARSSSPMQLHDPHVEDDIENIPVNLSYKVDEDRTCMTKKIAKKNSAKNKNNSKPSDMVDISYINTVYKRKMSSRKRQLQMGVENESDTSNTGVSRLALARMKSKGSPVQTSNQPAVKRKRVSFSGKKDIVQL